MHQETKSQGSTIVSCEIMIFVNVCSNMIEMKMFVLKWDDLADKDFSHYMTESEYFRYKHNWWISLNKSGSTGPLRNRSDFNEALSTLNRLHRECGGQQLSTMRFWKYQQRHPIIEFFLQLVAMEWFPGGVYKNSKKVGKRGCMQSDMIERWNLLCSVFG